MCYKNVFTYNIGYRLLKHFYIIILDLIMPSKLQQHRILF